MKNKLVDIKLLSVNSEILSNVFTLIIDLHKNKSVYRQILLVLDTFIPCNRVTVDLSDHPSTDSLLTRISSTPKNLVTTTEICTGYAHINEVNNL